VSGAAGFTTLLTTVVNAEKVNAYADVDESTFLRYQRQSTAGTCTHLTDKVTSAEMQLEGESGYPHKGRIESFDNRIQGTTGSILVRAIFDNKDGTLRPGSFVRMRLPAGQPYNGMLVTEHAIGTDQGQKFCPHRGRQHDRIQDGRARPAPWTESRDPQRPHQG